MNTKYFITVSWCGGPRGILCQKPEPYPNQHHSLAFPKDTPHTSQEMRSILKPFTVILDPKSEPFTEETIKSFSHFVPLAEYGRQFGIAMRPEDFLEHIKNIEEATP